MALYSLHCASVPVRNCSLTQSHHGLACCAVYSLVVDGDEFSFGRIHFTARHTPAHTSGHVVYILDGTPFHSQNSLFSGDLLFIAGAGDTVYTALLLDHCR